MTLRVLAHMKIALRKARTLIVYVVLLHLAQLVGDLLIPNCHFGNRLRGLIFRWFFSECGRRFAIAAGCVINGAWNLKIGDDVYIAHRCWLNATGGLVLGDRVIVSPNVVITTTAHAREEGKVSLRKSRQALVHVGTGTWIASNSVVTKGSVIGDGVIVGAGSVVSGELSANTLYAGNPLRAVKRLDL